MASCFTHLDRPGLESALAGGLAFLQHNQLPYGEFKTWAALDEAMTERHMDSSPFVTALVLYALHFVKRSQVQAMTALGLDFLSAEMKGPGLWCYWSSHNPQHTSLQPDLDVICCVSHILKHHGRTFPSNTAILLASRNAAGLFYTYVAPRPGAPPELCREMGRLVSPESLFKLAAAGMLHEVDAAVNANVVLALGENAHTQPAVNFLIDVVDKHQEAQCSRYYRSPLAFYYMLSRAYWNGVTALAKTQATVIERIAAHAGGDGFDSALAAALAACSLLNFKHRASPLPEAIAYIQNTQRQDGAWPAHPLYQGPAYYGSEELTTGLCLEAVARYAFT